MQSTGVALDSRNNLYISDQNNNRVLEYDALATSSLTADRVFGQEGSFYTKQANNGGVSASSLNSPIQVAVDASNNLYIGDAGNARVLKYNSPLAMTGVKGSGDTVADLVFGQGGSLTQSGCDNPVTGANSLCQPNGIGVDTSGDVFIADQGNSRVLEYEVPLSANPTASIVFGQVGEFNLTGCNSVVEPGFFFPSAGSLCSPQGLAIDETGTLYVGDTGNNRVLGFFRPYGDDPIADLVLGQPDTDHGSPNSPNASGLWAASGIAIDRSVTPNHLYVADTSNHRVLGYKNAESFANGAGADLVRGQPDFYLTLCNQGGPGPEQVSLCDPVGVAVDAQGNLFVADNGNNRVLEFPIPFEIGYLSNEPAEAVFGQNGSFTTRSCQNGASLSSSGM